MSRRDMTEAQARAELKRAMPWGRHFLVNEYVRPRFGVAVGNGLVSVRGNGNTLRAAVSAAIRAWLRAKGR